MTLILSNEDVQNALSTSDQIASSENRELLARTL